ncbi:MAG: hypothetical protein MK226_21485 [Saprospiraceae bacterium]|nr:hypothetical protein [Saprospiraceae bacterium]
MKKILTTFAFSFLFLSLTHAQVSKGMLLLDGEVGLGYQTSSNDVGEGVDITFSPIAAYFVSDHFMIGGGFASQTILSEGGDNTSFGLVPIVRYYFNPSSTNINYFAQLDGILEFSDNGSNAFGVSLGVNKFLNANVALEGGLSFTLLEDEFADDNTGLLSLNLGIRSFLSSSDRESWGQASSGIAPGVMMIGMSGANITLALSEVEFLTMSLVPNVGYFFTENIVLGGAVGLSFLTGLGDVEVWSGGISIQPFARYYFTPESRLAWFGQASIGYAIAGSDNPTFESTTNSFDFGIAGGGNLFLTSNFALEFTVGWNINGSNTEFEDSSGFFTDNETENTLNNIGFNVGFQYFWNRGSNK